MRNFLGKNSKQFLKTVIPKKLTSWRPILGNFWRISEESFTGNDSREVPRKFVKESHHIWRIWGNVFKLYKKDNAVFKHKNVKLKEAEDVNSSYPSF